MKKTYCFISVCFAVLLLACAAAFSAPGMPVKNVSAVSVSGSISKTLDVEAAGDWYASTANLTTFGAVQYKDDALKPVKALVNDTAKYTVMKLEYPGGADVSKVAFRALLTTNATNMCIKANTTDNRGDGNWVTVSEYDAGKITGAVFNEAGIFTDSKISYYYFSAGQYFGSGTVLYVSFEAKNTGAGNGTAIFGHVDIYDSLAVDDGTITVGGEKITAPIEDAGYFYENNGSTLMNSAHSWKWRYADNAKYWSYKARWENGAGFAAFTAILKKTANMYIGVSADNITYTQISGGDMPRFGADYSEACFVTANDGSFMRYYFSLGAYFNGGDTLYIKFGAQNTASGNGVQAAAEVEFLPQWKQVVNYVDMSVNSVSVDPADASAIFVDNGSKTSSNPIGAFRFADTVSYFTYMLVMDSDKASDIYMKAVVTGTNRGISFSGDNSAYTQIAFATSPDGAYGADTVLSDGRTYFYKLDTYVTPAFVDGAQKKVAYVKFHASNTALGNGSAVYSLQFFNGAVRPAGKGQQSVLPAGKLAAEIDIFDDSLIHSKSGESATGTYLGQWGRVAPGVSSVFAYKFTLPETARTFCVAVNSINSLVFRASSDDSDYKAFSALNSEAVGNGAAITYDLSELLKNGRDIYVRFNGSTGHQSMLLSFFAMYNDSALTPAAKKYSGADYQAFSAGDDREKLHWQNQSTNNIAFNGNYREFNYDAEGIYLFNYAEGSKAVNLHVSTGGTFVLSVSADGQNWIDIAVSDIQYISGDWWEKRAEIYADISAYVLKADNAARSVYVKIADAVADNPYGAALRGIVVESLSGTETTPSAPPEKSGCGRKAKAAGNAAALPLLFLAYVILKKSK